MEPMGKLLGHTPNGMGLAATGVLAALLDRLIANQIITRAQVADIFNEARTALSHDFSIIPVADAMDIVSKLADRFE